MTTKVAPVETVYDTLPSSTDEPISPRDIAEVTDMGYSTVTRHLRALEAAGRAEKIDPVEKGAPVLWFAARAGTVRQQPAARELADTLKAKYPGEAEKIEQAYADTAPATPPDTAPAPVPFDPGSGPELGYFAGLCGHRVATSEWRAGFRVCERCPAPSPDADPVTADDYTEHFPGDPDVLAEGDPSPIPPAPTSGDMAAITEWMEAESARPVSPASALAAIIPPPAANQLTADEARTLTADIRARVTDLLPLIKEAFTRRADLALGYQSWSAYCDAELRGLRMPLQERQAATAVLRAEGLSTRAIAGALGTSDATVRRDLRDAGATDDAPERAVGLDGKSYATRRPPAATETAAAASDAADASGEESPRDDSVRAAAAPSPSTPDGEGVTPAGAVDPADPQPTPYEAAKAHADQAAFAAKYPTASAEVDGDGQRVIEGEIVADPGPVPEPAPLDPRTRVRIDDSLGTLDRSVGNLAELLREAGPHAPVYLRDLRDLRHQLDLIIRAVEAVDA